MSKKGKIMFFKYKHLIFAIVIVIIVIILDIIFENYTKSSIKKINGNLDKIHDIFDQNNDNYDESKLENLSNQAVHEWKKRQEFLTCFIEHDEIEKVSVKLRLLQTQIKNNFWSDAKSTVEETKQLVKYLNTRHTLSLQNIF